MNYKNGWFYSVNPADSSLVFRLDPAVPSDQKIISAAVEMEKVGTDQKMVEKEVAKMVHETYPGYRGEPVRAD